jgi:hypothetical protein
MACDLSLLGVMKGISYKEHCIPAFPVSICISVSITLVELKVTTTRW